MKRKQQFIACSLSVTWALTGHALIPMAATAQTRKPPRKTQPPHRTSPAKNSRRPFFFKPGPKTITSGAGGATRNITQQRVGGYCGPSQMPMTALIPPEGLLLTSQTNASLWIALPRKLMDRSEHEFLLAIAPINSGTPVQIRQRVRATPTGLAEVQIPATAITNGNDYRWELTYTCRDRTTGTPTTMSGYIGVRPLSPPNVSDRRDLSRFYGENSAWVDLWNSLLGPPQGLAADTLTPSELRTLLNSPSVRLGNFYDQVAAQIFPQQSSPEKSTELRPTANFPKLQQFRNQLQSLSNQSRVSQGLSQLSSPSALNQAAQDYAEVLARNDCPPIHTCGGKGLSDRLADANIESVFRAENMVTIPKQTLKAGEKAHDLLINSWPHRRNTLLPEWTEAGVGVAEGPDAYHFVQIFNQPQGPTSMPSQLGKLLPISSKTPRLDFERVLQGLSPEKGVSLIEGKKMRDFALFLGSKFIKNSNSPEPTQIANKLTSLKRETGKKAGLIYVVATEQELRLYLVAPPSAATQPIIIQKTVPVSRRDVLGTAQQFHRRVTNPSHPTGYLPYAVQLHRWLIEPLQPTIDQLQLDTLLFTLDDGLRSMPVAALHNGRNFLIERYSVALIPSFGLTDPNDFKVGQQRLLAMGITESRSGLSQLPAVKTEVTRIAQGFTTGQKQITLNQRTTLQQLQSLSRSRKYGIIHLATHAQFRPGRVQDSYIQFWDQRLTLDRLGLLGRELDWDAAPTVEMLVLSACTTALGDRSVELGLAGSAVLAGVKSTIANLWNVNDVSSTAFMIEFYRQLPQVPIKAEAIRQTQIAMLRQQLKVENGKIVLPNQTTVPLSSPALQSLSLPFSHPYYWAGHTVIGNWN